MSKRKLSEAQIWLMGYLGERYGMTAVATEYRFDMGRRWRFDVAIPLARFAFEIEGGVWVRGRHTRGPGFIRDAEKYNHAAALGWRVFRFTPNQILKGEAKQFIEARLL